MKKITVMGLVTVVSLSVNAALVHRYDFATDASDGVGSADGTLIGGAISGGVLTTAADAGGWSGDLATGAPQNGVQLDASAVAGITGAFTIEYWGTIGYGGGYTTAFSFSDASTANYLLATPARGNSPYASSISVIGGGTGLAEQQATGQYIDNGAHHMLVTYDGTTLTYYQDAQTDLGGFNTANSLSASIVVPGLNLSSLTAIGIAGGAPWPDNSVAADTQDFRIYDNAVNAGQVAALYALGADALNEDISSVIPEPATIGLYGLVGAGVLFVRRRFRN